MLSQYISPADIKINLESREKEECFAELLEVIVAKHPQINRLEAMNALIQRDEMSSTAVFPSVAVPHGTINSLSKTAISIGISKQGIEFESVCESETKNPLVNIIFEVLFYNEKTDLQIYVLRDIINLVDNSDFVRAALKCSSAQEVFDLIVASEK